MSLSELIVVGVRTSDGERFFVGPRQHGEKLDAGASVARGFPPPLSAETRAALSAVEIIPYAPLPEAVLRGRLAALGLSDVEVEGYVQEARKWMTTVSTVWPPHH